MTNPNASAGPVADGELARLNSAPRLHRPESRYSRAERGHGGGSAPDPRPQPCGVLPEPQSLAGGLRLYPLSGESRTPHYADTNLVRPAT